MFNILLLVTLVTCCVTTVHQLIAVNKVTFYDQIVLSSSSHQQVAAPTVLECMRFSTGNSWKSFFYRPFDGLCQRNAEVFSEASNWEPGNGTKFYVFVKDCPISDGYSLDKNNKFCFKIHYDIPRTWPVARQMCNEEGGDLAIVDTQEKHEQVVSIIRNSTSLNRNQFCFYIGARKTADKGWRWVNGKSLPLNDSNWGLTEPNNVNGTQEYVTIANYKEQKFDDYYTAGECYFICEITTQ